MVDTGSKVGQEPEACRIATNRSIAVDDDHPVYACRDGGHFDDPGTAIHEGGPTGGTLCQCSQVLDRGARTVPAGYLCPDVGRAADAPPSPCRVRSAVAPEAPELARLVVFLEGMCSVAAVQLDRQHRATVSDPE